MSDEEFKAFMRHVGKLLAEGKVSDEVPEGLDDDDEETDELEKAFDESKHPRETETHDGRKPGEFAPGRRLPTSLPRIDQSVVGVPAQHIRWFHGTSGDFDPQMIAYGKIGAFLTSSPSQAAQYAKDVNVYEYSVKPDANVADLDDPVVVEKIALRMLDTGDFEDEDEAKQWSEEVFSGDLDPLDTHAESVENTSFYEAAFNAGYDGVKHSATGDRASLVMFYPELLEHNKDAVAFFKSVGAEPKDPPDYDLRLGQELGIAAREWDEGKKQMEQAKPGLASERKKIEARMAAIRPGLEEMLDAKAPLDKATAEKALEYLSLMKRMDRLRTAERLVGNAGAQKA